MADWEKALELDDLWDGDMVGVEIGTSKVLLIHLDGTVKAYVDRCPHQEWPLSSGDLDDGVLVCANHLWEFDAASGEGINPTDCALRSLECKIENGVVYVAVEAT